MATPAAHPILNLLQGPLQACSMEPRTGYLRDGFCRPDSLDRGTHLVCAEMTDAFLDFTGAHGNNLRTPRAGFPGLHAHDRWCVCALRWQEAKRAGVAPPVVPEATHEFARRYADL